MNIQQKTFVRIRMEGQKVSNLLPLLVLAMVNAISNDWLENCSPAKQGLFTLVSGTHKSELDKLSQLKQHAVGVFAKGSHSLFYKYFWFTCVSIKSQ